MSRRNHNGGIRRLVTGELFRLGLHAKTRDVVAALARRGIKVSASLVNRIRLDLLAKPPRGQRPRTKPSRPRTLAQLGRVRGHR